MSGSQKNSKSDELGGLIALVFIAIMFLFALFIAVVLISVIEKKFSKSNWMWPDAISLLIGCIAAAVLVLFGDMRHLAYGEIFLFGFGATIFMFLIINGPTTIEASEEIIGFFTSGVRGREEESVSSKSDAKMYTDLIRSGMSADDALTAIQKFKDGESGRVSETHNLSTDFDTPVSARKNMSPRGPEADDINPRRRKKFSG